MWLGPLVVILIAAIHLGCLASPGMRLAELRWLLAVGVLGALSDTLLSSQGLVTYPTSVGSWSFRIAPPWIVALWVLFATLPGFSLRWLLDRPLLAALFGAIGGPLSFFAGVRLGAIGTGPAPTWTYLALAAEYAIFMPLLVKFAPAQSMVKERLRAPYGTLPQ